MTELISLIFKTKKISSNNNLSLLKNETRIIHFGRSSQLIMILKIIILEAIYIYIFNSF